jgi:hypothetical protein
VAGGLAVIRPGVRSCPSVASARPSPRASGSAGRLRPRPSPRASPVASAASVAPGSGRHRGLGRHPDPAAIPDPGWHPGPGRCLGLARRCARSPPFVRVSREPATPCQPARARMASGGCWPCPPGRERALSTLVGWWTASCGVVANTSRVGGGCGGGPPQPAQLTKPGRRAWIWWPEPPISAENTNSDGPIRTWGVKPAAACGLRRSGCGAGRCDRNRSAICISSLSFPWLRECRR